jgi:hypothetical protein
VGLGVVMGIQYSLVFELHRIKGQGVTYFGSAYSGRKRSTGSYSYSSDMSHGNNPIDEVTPSTMHSVRHSVNESSWKAQATPNASYPSPNLFLLFSIHAEKDKSAKAKASHQMFQRTRTIKPLSIYRPQAQRENLEV